MSNRPISTSFSPNFERDDVVLATKLLFNMIPSELLVGSIDKLKDEIKKMFPSSEVSLFSSGRAALYHSLKAMDFTNGDEVLLQAFTCVAIPNAVLWNDLRPIFVDCDNDYNLNVEDLENKITPRSKAIIVQHTFGIPANIEKILLLAKKHGLVVIEDCAHALGVEHNGKALGSFGDVAILSFGRDKIISSVFGGAAISKSPEMAKKILMMEGKLQPAPRFFTIQQLLYLIIYAMSLPVYTLGFGKIILSLSRMFGLLSRAVYKEEWSGSMPSFIQYSFPQELSFLALQQWNKLDGFKAHRLEISSYYIDALKLSLAPKPYLRIPFLVKNKTTFLEGAKHKGLHLGNWYRGAVDPTGSDLKQLGYQPCQNAENLALHTINLPTHTNISMADAKEIVLYIQQQIKTQ